MGDSYQVVWSERDIFMAWGHLAGSGMLLLPAIAAGPRRGGRGHSECPIQVTTHRFGVAPSGYVCVCACARVRVCVCMCVCSGACPHKLRLQKIIISG